MEFNPPNVLGLMKTESHCLFTISRNMQLEPSRVGNRLGPCPQHRHRHGFLGQLSRAGRWYLVTAVGPGTQSCMGAQGAKPLWAIHRQSHAAAQLTLQMLQGKKQLMEEFRWGIPTALVRGDIRRFQLDSSNFPHLRLSPSKHCRPPTSVQTWSLP